MTPARPCAMKPVTLPDDTAQSRAHLLRVVARFGMTTAASPRPSLHQMFEPRRRQISRIAGQEPASNEGIMEKRASLRAVFPARSTRPSSAFADQRCQRPLKPFSSALSFVLATFVVAGGLGVKASTNERRLLPAAWGLQRSAVAHSHRIRGRANISKVTNGALHGLAGVAGREFQLSGSDRVQGLQAAQGEGKASIGAAISKRYGYAAVISVIPGGPADKAGVKRATSSRPSKARRRATCRWRRLMACWPDSRGR